MQSPAEAHSQAWTIPCDSDTLEEHCDSTVVDRQIMEIPTPARATCNAVLSEVSHPVDVQPLEHKSSQPPAPCLEMNANALEHRLPLEPLAPYLEVGELCQLLAVCREALMAMTVEKEGGGRLIVAPVLTLTLMNCERAMELVSMPHVEVLRVFSRVAMELVKSAVLRSRNAALRPLRRFTAQGTAVHQDDIDGFLDQLLARPGLVMVNFERNNLKDESAAALVKRTLSRSTAETFCARRNHISDLSCEALAEVLKRDTPLKVLNLKANRVSNAGAMMIADALRGNHVLTLCNLRCQVPALSDPAAQSFATALAMNRTLLRLRLRRNKIGDDGAAALAEALRTSNSTLVELDLQANRVDFKGGIALTRALEANRSLEEVHLALNRCDREKIKNNIGAADAHLADDPRLIFEELPDV